MNPSPKSQPESSADDDSDTPKAEMNDGEEQSPPSSPQHEEAPLVDSWMKQVDKILTEPAPEIIPDPPVDVLPWLYLSPIFCVRDRAANLSELGITHVISTNRMAPQAVETLYWELRSHGIDHLYVAADDEISYDMVGRHWEECRVFLEEARKSGGNMKALVHCNAGMNRSGMYGMVPCEWRQSN